MEYIVVGGYYTPGKTPQIIGAVKDKIALGYVPYGTPVLIESSGWLSQSMVKGAGGAATNYTLQVGYENKSPFLPAGEPVGGNWYMLGSLLRRSDSYNIQAWMQGTQVIAPIDLATQVTGVLPIIHGGTSANNIIDARTNFELDRFVQLAANGETRMYNGARTLFIYATNSPNWGAFTSDGQPFALRIDRGGTGALTPQDARFNIQTPYRAYTGLTAAQNLNDLRGPQAGDYHNQSNANATAANNYPEVNAGALQVYQNAANGVDGCTQVYQPFNNHKMYSRYYSASSSAWGGWGRMCYIGTAVNMAAGSLNWNTIHTYSGGLDQGGYDIFSFINGTTATNGPGINYGTLQTIRGVPDTGSASYVTQMVHSKDTPFPLRYRTKNDDAGNTWPAWQTVWHISGTTYTGATTVDANGFVKIASPIVNLFGDGTNTHSEEAEGVVTSRLSTGVYLMTGVLGFNSDATWHVEVPKDINGQPLLWVDYTVAGDGSITIRTYHRVHPDSPEYARNIIVGVQNGDPLDITSGKSLTLRVNMPA